MTVPGNATATIYVPTVSKAAVTESGAKVEKAQGVTKTRKTQDALSIEVGSGTYRFRSRLPKPPREVRE